jgi:hypothetical protein
VKIPKRKVTSEDVAFAEEILALVMELAAIVLIVGVGFLLFHLFGKAGLLGYIAVPFVLVLVDVITKVFWSEVK